MSTTFDVFPTTANIPTFRKLLDLATRHLDAFLQSYGITQRVQLVVALRNCEPDYAIEPFDLGGPAWWPEDCYAWFHVPAVAGGTDAYASPIDDLGRSTIEDVRARGGPGFIEMTVAALHVGRYWSFRRSTGQPAIINVAYGMLAGSLAELTNGFVYSIDGAWDHKRLPAFPDVFLSNYFRPELNPDWKEHSWAKRCINGLQEEVSAVQFGE